MAVVVVVQSEAFNNTQKHAFFRRSSVDVIWSNIASFGLPAFFLSFSYTCFPIATVRGLTNLASTFGLLSVQNCTSVILIRACPSSIVKEKSSEIAGAIC